MDGVNCTGLQDVHMCKCQCKLVKSLCLSLPPSNLVELNDWTRYQIRSVGSATAVHVLEANATMRVDMHDVYDVMPHSCIRSLYIDNLHVMRLFNASSDYSNTRFSSSCSLT